MKAIKWGFMSFKADPEKVWDELGTLGDSYSPDDVLTYARTHIDSELHKCFEWDDSAAAEKWRKQQARWVCNSITVVVEAEEKEPQQFRLIQHDKEDKVYRPVTFTVRNNGQYSRLLNQAKQELRAFKARYQQIVELQNVIEEIEKVI